MAKHAACLAVGLCVSAAGSALGQAAFPAVFSTNNGNLRGSVTSYRVNADGTVSAVQEFVIANRASSEPSLPGTNAYAGALTPNGKYLAVTHATGRATEQITILQVAADATLSLYTTFTTPEAFEVAWLDDTTLAATETRSVGGNWIRVYRFDEQARTFTLIDNNSVGGFCSWLTLSKDRRWLISNDSPLNGGSRLVSFEVLPDKTLEPRGQIAFSGYALGMCLSNDAQFLYSPSGSSGTPRINAFSFDTETGTPNFLPMSPYPVAGSSPKQCVVSPDGTKLIVCYGGDGTVRVNEIVPGTGEIVPTNTIVDIGGQSTVGNMDVMRIPGMDLVFFTDKETFDGTPRGMCSYKIEADGTLTEMSLRVDGGGISPQDVIAWAGPQAPTCGTADFNGDSEFGTDADIEAFFQCLAGNCCSTCFALGADFNADGDAGTDADIESFFRVLAGGNC